MFKKIASAVLACAMLLASAAHAGTPASIKNATGTQSYGTEYAMSVEKDTSAGFNRVKVRYPSGFQYVTDNANWSVYANFVAAMIKPLASPSYGNGLVYDHVKVFVNCQSNQTNVHSTLAGAPDALPDNCALHQASQQNSQ